MSPGVTEVDDRAAGPVGADKLNIDENSLEGQIGKAAKRNRASTAPYRKYVRGVIKLSGVRDSQMTRRLASNICGAVARLPFLPDDQEAVEEGKEGKPGKTEFDLQVEKTAAQAENALGSEAVWTVSARKIARAALELRKEDPDGKKGKAWVNAPFEPVRGAVPRALRGEEEPDGEDED